MSALFIGFVYMATISGFVLNILAYFSVIFTFWTDSRGLWLVKKHIFVFSWHHNSFFFYRSSSPLSCPLISCQRRKVQSQGVSWPGWQFILLDFNQSIKPSWAGCFERSSALEQSGGSISCPCQHRNEDWLRTLMLDVKHQASITCNVATSTPSGWCWSEWSLRRR